MTDIYELHPGYQLHLTQIADRTTLTVTQSALGQQQQSSTTLTIGPWTAPPQVTPLPSGAIVILTTAQGQHTLHIQGTQIAESAAPTSVPPSPHHPPTPLPPLQPLKMGNMEMNFSPMHMKMGNMELQMPPLTPMVATPTPGPAPAATSPEPSPRRFCTQCGQTIQPSDRFCAHCGHALQPDHG